MIMDTVLSVGTSSQPVVVGTGGALTTVASAYLLANRAGRGAEFASKMVLYAGIGADGTHVLNGYNESQDEWAVYVCQQRLKVVFTEYTNADHNQPKFWAMIDALPDNEIGQYVKTTKANWPYAPYQGVGDEMPVLTLLNPRQGSYFNSTERVTFDHWDSAAWSWGAPGPNNINWNAYPAYLNLRSEPTADDIAAWRLNAQDDFITGTFTRAFASASAGGSVTAAAPHPGRAAPRNPAGAELTLRLTPRSAVRRRGGRVAYRLRVSAPRRRLSRVRVCVRTGSGMRIIRARSARLRGRRGCWRIRRLARGHTRSLRARTRISTRYTGHRITVRASARRRHRHGPRPRPGANLTLTGLGVIFALVGWSSRAWSGSHRERMISRRGSVQRPGVLGLAL